MTEHSLFCLFMRNHGKDDKCRCETEMVPAGWAWCDPLISELDRSAIQVKVGNLLFPYDKVQIEKVVSDDARLDGFEYFLNSFVKGTEIAERRCRVCGCIDEDCSGCIERTGEPCYWVEDDLCSACKKN